jgi:tRNA-Thr(GGU) m(6)t(6)A37 methyltransferase TsaA
VRSLRALADCRSVYELRPIGRVESPLTERAVAPKQGDEGSPEAWLVLDVHARAGATDLRAGMEVLVLTWLHLADRSTLRVHPRGVLANPVEGVFSTRSPDRPNPIGLHRVAIVAVEADGRLRVRDLEALDGTPIVDIKPVLDPVREK